MPLYSIRWFFNPMCLVRFLRFQMHIRLISLARFGHLGMVSNKEIIRANLVLRNDDLYRLGVVCVRDRGTQQTDGTNNLRG